MAKRRLRGLFDSNPKQSTAIDEALASVRAAAPAGGEQSGATEAGQKAEKGTPGAETKGLPAQDLPTPEELAARLGDDDAADDPKTAPEGLKDPTAGFESPRERLVGQLGSTDPTDTVGPGDDSSRGKDDSMIADQPIQGFLSPPEGTIADDGEVKGAPPSFGTTVRGALGDLPFVGKYVEEALTAAERSGGGYAQRVEEAAAGDPATSTGTDEPGTDEPGSDEPGSDEPGTDEPGSDEPEGQGDSDVMHEFDNDDGSHTTVYNDGTIITTSKDGQEVNYPDGTTEYYDSEGNLIAVEDEGEQQSQEADQSQEGDNASPAGEEEGEDEDGEPEDEDEPEGEGEGSGEPEEGGGAEMSGDPDEEFAPLPEGLQQLIDADVAAVRDQSRTDSGDGVTDPDPNAEPVIAGPVADAHAELGSMLGNPGGPDDMYGTGAGVPPGTAPPQDSGVIDPGPDADTGVQTAGPEERTTGGSIAGLGPPATGSTGPEDGSTDDAADSIRDLAIQSPLREEIGPLRLASGDDASEEPDDADD